MNEIIQSLYARKSVRAYTDRPVPAEVKRTVLAAAVQAPTAGGQQLYTILDKPFLKEMGAFYSWNLFGSIAWLLKGAGYGTK